MLFMTLQLTEVDVTHWLVNILRTPDKLNKTLVCQNYEYNYELTICFKILYVKLNVNIFNFHIKLFKHFKLMKYL